MHVDDRELLVDLMSLDVQDFDPILGIDWLSSHHASIDCFLKKIGIFGFCMCLYSNFIGIILLLLRN